MKVLMIRHGATAGNLEKRYVGRTNEGLTEQAVSNLRERAPKLRELAGNVAEIITSPMKRCLETAEVLFPEKLYENVPRIQKAGLSECDFGKFEYKNYMELSGDAEYQHFIDTMGKAGFPGGETTDAFKARTVKAFREVLKEIPPQAEQDDLTLVFVVHGGTIMAVMEAFSEEKKGYYDWQVGNGDGVIGKIDILDELICNAQIVRVKQNRKNERDEIYSSLFESPAELRILNNIRLGVAGSVRDIIRFKYDTVNYIEIIYLRWLQLWFM